MLLAILHLNPQSGRLHLQVPSLSALSLKDMHLIITMMIESYEAQAKHSTSNKLGLQYLSHSEMISKWESERAFVARLKSDIDSLLQHAASCF